MADHGAGSAVDVAWDVTTACRRVVNGLTPVVVLRDEGRGFATGWLSSS
jgi:hypothetical protein